MHQPRVGDLGAAEVERLQVGQPLEVHQPRAGDLGSVEDEVCDRVPLVIRVPGLTKPRSSTAGLVELVDLFPTLSELCSLKPPADLQGRSLVPMLRDPGAPGKNVAYTVVRRGQKLGKAIRSGRWRYALWPDGEELYDLEKDSNEFVNLAKSKTHADVVAGLRVELVRAGKIAAARRKREGAATPNSR
jgi:arylsulfatase A-like enzyme